MIVIGGTYDEHCFEPRWREKYGSGLRACWVLAKLDPTASIVFHTFGDIKTKSYLDLVAHDIKLTSHIVEIPKTIEFQYDHPLSVPAIFPRPDILNKSDNNISVEGDNFLYYGFIEGNAQITGKKVVYDPQSPANPIPFSATGSTAEQLAVVINFTEARRIIGKRDVDIDAIKDFFFNNERASVIVLKMGPRGALVMTPNGTDEIIPVYETKSVWPIGSGDVFAAVFAHHWLNGADPVIAAQNASWNTAVYCSSKGFFFSAIGSDPDIKPLKITDYPKEQIYLAGPFFTFAQRWLINQIYRSLIDMNLKVFSPWHDVGHGEASDVVHLDIEGLKKSKLVFAVIDGLDSGTLIEVGYAIAIGIPIIGFVQNETSENTKMMDGTNCMMENDFTTAVYKSLWLLAKNE